MNDAVQRLLLVREQAVRARDDAQRALQEAEKHCAQARSQAEILHSYRNDTASRWTRPQDRNTDRIQMGTAHQFLARLDTAMQQNEATLRHVEAQAQLRREELLRAETRLAGLTKVIEHRQRLAVAHQERRDQRALDELAQRRKTSGDISEQTEELQPCPH
jgi:flagellar protein FliJ